MAWSISIAAEGWQRIRQELQRRSRQSLIAAIANDKFEEVLAKGGHQHAEQAASAERRRLRRLPHDVLVDRALELVGQNDTCGNGGYGFWIDREGYHQVWLPGDEDE